MQELFMTKSAYRVLFQIPRHELIAFVVECAPRKQNSLTDLWSLEDIDEAVVSYKAKEKGSWYKFSIYYNHFR